MNRNEKIIEFYEKSFKSLGAIKFYNKILGDGVLERNNCDYPEIELLNRAEDFFSLARRTGNDNYFCIGKILRKAAHRLYRDGQRRNSEYPVNTRFLRII